LNTIFSRYPFVRYCFSLILGIVVFLNFPFQLPYLSYFLIFLSISYCTIYVKFGGKARFGLGILGLLFLFAFGYFSASKSLLVKTNSAVLDSVELDFYQAKLISLVEDKPKSWKATAVVNKLILGKETQLCNAKVLLYFDKNSVDKPNYGDIFLIKGKPTSIEPPKNPNQFNYKQYLSYQNIYHQHYLKDTSFVFVSNEKKVGLKAVAFKINNYCDSVFTKYITNKTELAVTNAMILGLRDDIDNDLLSAYSAAGAIHVLSVSGLHVGVIYLILVRIFGFLKHNKRYGKWFFLVIILSILWLYALVTGLSSPVLRSTFMFSLILISETVGRQHNAYNTVSISAFFLLLFDPLLLINVGFMLSYLAVFGMIMIQPILNPIWVIDKRKSILHWLGDRIWKVTTVAVAAQIATLPITIYYFHQFPNYFLLVNPIVILLSSIVLVGGLVLLVLIFLFDILNLAFINVLLGKVFQFFVWALNGTVTFTEKLPGSVGHFLNFTISEMVLLYLLIAFLLAFWYSKKYIWVKLSIFATSLLIDISIVSFVSANNNNKICLHAISKTTAISVIKGRNVHLFANSDFLNDRKSIGFNLLNYWSVSGVNDTAKYAMPQESFIKVLKGKSFLFLSNKFLFDTSTSPLSVDYLIIRHKKLRYSNDIKNKVKFKYLIIDGSVSQFYANRFEQEAANDGIMAYYLLKRGAIEL
jgi:competence protein ComEC